MSRTSLLTFTAIAALATSGLVADGAFAAERPANHWGNRGALTTSPPHSASSSFNNGRVALGNSGGNVKPVAPPVIRPNNPLGPVGGGRVIPGNHLPDHHLPPTTAGSNHLPDHHLPPTTAGSNHLPDHHLPPTNLPPTVPGMGNLHLNNKLAIDKPILVDPRSPVRINNTPTTAATGTAPSGAGAVRCGLPGLPACGGSTGPSAGPTAPSVPARCGLPGLPACGGSTGPSAGPAQPFPLRCGLPGLPPCGGSTGPSAGPAQPFPLRCGLPGLPPCGGSTVPPKIEPPATVEPSRVPQIWILPRPLVIPRPIIVNKDAGDSGPGQGFGSGQGSGSGQSWTSAPPPATTGTTAQRYNPPQAVPTCLTKTYLQAGTVMFRDVCTQEWAINTTSVTVQAAAKAACLVKENPQNGVVLFKDLCTNEWAMNPPADNQTQTN